MDITSTDAAGEAPPTAISALADAGPVERGTEIIALAGANAHLELIAEINSEHRLATRCAQDAVQHAIRCGYLLGAQKKRLPHGEFSKWIKVNCEFAYSTAARYMTAAKQISQGVEISSLSALFPSGRKPTKHTISTEEMASATRETTTVTKRRTTTAPAALMSGAPSVQPQPRDAIVAKAARELKRAGRSLGRLQALSVHRDAAARLRKDLERAEAQLRRTEDEVLQAWRELPRKEAQA